ncbi:5807_t:CDS:1 [Paraglomus brasilianum]|uniref:5807_t:CDS:1 n=1 Tax=Paraglomus brasilianum TaxID=144538 RepID=A0A9N8ZZ34_9GLOM|nr:5807_t:CDS:1 [Paraglomus brasilianum]
MDTNKFDSYTTTATITKFLVDIQDYIGKDKLIIYSNPVGFKNKKNEQANTSQREACQRSQEKKGVRTRIYTAFQDLCSISRDPQGALTQWCGSVFMQAKGFTWFISNIGVNRQKYFHERGVSQVVTVTILPLPTHNSL